MSRQCRAAINEFVAVAAQVAMIHLQPLGIGYRPFPHPRYGITRSHYIQSKSRESPSSDSEDRHDRFLLQIHVSQRLFLKQRDESEPPEQLVTCEDHVADDATSSTALVDPSHPSLSCSTGFAVFDSSLLNKTRDSEVYFKVFAPTSSSPQSEESAAGVVVVQQAVILADDEDEKKGEVNEEEEGESARENQQFSFLRRRPRFRIRVSFSDLWEDVEFESTFSFSPRFRTFRERIAVILKRDSEVEGRPKWARVSFLLRVETAASSSSSSSPSPVRELLCGLPTAEETFPFYVLFSPLYRCYAPILAMVISYLSSFEILTLASRLSKYVRSVAMERVLLQGTATFRGSTLVDSTMEDENIWLDLDLNKVLQKYRFSDLDLFHRKYVTDDMYRCHVPLHGIRSDRVYCPETVKSLRIRFDDRFAELDSDPFTQLFELFPSLEILTIDMQLSPFGDGLRFHQKQYESLRVFHCQTGPLRQNADFWNLADYLPTMLSNCPNLFSISAPFSLRHTVVDKDPFEGRNWVWKTAARGSSENAVARVREMGVIQEGSSCWCDRDVSLRVWRGGVTGKRYWIFGGHHWAVALHQSGSRLLFSSLNYGSCILADFRFVVQKVSGESKGDRTVYVEQIDQLWLGYGETFLLMPVWRGLGMVYNRKVEEQYGSCYDESADEMEEVRVSFNCKIHREVSHENFSPVDPRRQSLLRAAEAGILVSDASDLSPPPNTSVWPSGSGIPDDYELFEIVCREKMVDKRAGRNGCAWKRSYLIQTRLGFAFRFVAESHPPDLAHAIVSLVQLAPYGRSVEAVAKLSLVLVIRNQGTSDDRFSRSCLFLGKEPLALCRLRISSSSVVPLFSCSLGVRVDSVFPLEIWESNFVVQKEKALLPNDDEEEDSHLQHSFQVEIDESSEEVHERFFLGQTSWLVEFRRRQGLHALPCLVLRRNFEGNCAAKVSFLLLLLERSGRSGGDDEDEESDVICLGPRQAWFENPRSSILLSNLDFLQLGKWVLTVTAILHAVAFPSEEKAPPATQQQPGESTPRYGTTETKIVTFNVNSETSRMMSIVSDPIDLCGIPFVLEFSPAGEFVQGQVSVVLFNSLSPISSKLVGTFSCALLSTEEGAVSSPEDYEASNWSTDHWGRGNRYLFPALGSVDPERNSWSLAVRVELSSVQKELPKRVANQEEFVFREEESEEDRDEDDFDD